LPENFHDSLRLKAIRFAGQNQAAGAMIGHSSACLQVSFAEKLAQKEELNEVFVAGDRLTIASR
jgi:hypothetical protein